MKKGPAARSSLPPLLAISRPQARQVELLRWAEGLAGAGLTWLQVRTFSLDDRALLAALRALRQRLSPEVRLTINGRPDLCHLAGFDGVHLPVHGLPVAAARRVAGSNVLVGRSTHSLAEVHQAATEGADYALFGPIHAPGSKAGARPPTGLQELALACTAPVPVFALGGVTISRLADLGVAGAAGAAGISMFDCAADARALVDRAATAFHRPTPLPNLPFEEPSRTS
jgi:thiamine-phosphate pyrophosphorylase